MKALFIGGTGNISTACTRKALTEGWEIFHMNRGKSNYSILKGVKTLTCDINNRSEVETLLKGMDFDVVANFIAFHPREIERDYQVFRNITKQYIFISSASIYQKPPTFPVITESTPLHNPYWEYSRNKIDAENKLQQLYRDFGFPITIVRPSHTYEYAIPVSIGSWTDFTIIERIRKGKPIIVHGDGTSLWTLTHSDDFAKGFVGLMGHQQAIGHAFHITSDEILTWNQIYEAVAEAAGNAPKIYHIASEFICDVADRLSFHGIRGSLLGDKSASAIFDNSKIKSFVPGYMATIPFRQGIKRTINWFDEEKSRQIINNDNNTLIDRVIEAYTPIQ